VRLGVGVGVGVGGVLQVRRIWSHETVRSTHCEADYRQLVLHANSDSVVHFTAVDVRIGGLLGMINNC